MRPLGRHFIAELYNCSMDELDDASKLENVLLSAAQIGDLTVLGTTLHQFEPFGVTGVLLLKESHMSIHTWPELGYAAVDLFTCSVSGNPEKAITWLKERLGCNHLELKVLERGFFRDTPS